MTILYDAPANESDHQPREVPARSTRPPGYRLFVATVWGMGVLVLALGAMAWVAGDATVSQDDRILVSGSDSVFLLDPAEPVPVYTVENAVASPDRSRLYQLLEDDGTTIINEIDSDTGETVGSRVVPEPRQEIRIVSPDGDALALMEARGNRDELYVPEPRTETAITVVWREVAEPKRFDLEGNFEPEAFTRDGRTLYLLEFWPADAPDRYFVRSLDLESGEITDTFSPEVDLNPEMRGHARAQVIHPDGDFLYTMYTLDDVGKAVVDPEAEGVAARWAFVHVISLNEDWSFCIFLPLPMGRNEATVGLAITPDGSTLYAVDAGADMVASIDTESMRVTESASLGGWGAQTGERVPTAAGPDGSLFVAFDQTVIRYTDLAPNSVWWSDWKVESIDVSPNGSELRAAVPGFVKVVDLDSGQETAAIRIPDTEAGVDFVGPPLNPNAFGASKGGGPLLPCAC